MKTLRGAILELCSPIASSWVAELGLDEIARRIARCWGWGLRRGEVRHAIACCKEAYAPDPPKKDFQLQQRLLADLYAAAHQCSFALSEIAAQLVGSRHRVCGRNHSAKDQPAFQLDATTAHWLAHGL